MLKRTHFELAGHYLGFAGAEEVYWRVKRVSRKWGAGIPGRLGIQWLVSNHFHTFWSWRGRFQLRWVWFIAIIPLHFGALKQLYDVLVPLVLDRLKRNPDRTQPFNLRRLREEVLARDYCWFHVSFYCILCEWWIFSSDCSFGNTIGLTVWQPLLSSGHRWERFSWSTRRIHNRYLGGKVFLSFNPVVYRTPINFIIHTISWDVYLII